MIKLKVKTMTVRLTDEEYERYTKLAAEAGMYLSTWVKMMIKKGIKND